MKTWKKRHDIFFGTVDSLKTAGTVYFPEKKLGIPFLDDILLTRAELPSRIAMEIIVQGCWAIWGKRNGKIFRKEVPNVNSWKFKLREDLKLLEHRIKAKYLEALQGWISDRLG